MTTQWRYGKILEISKSNVDRDVGRSFKLLFSFLGRRLRSVGTTPPSPPRVSSCQIVDTRRTFGVTRPKESVLDGTFCYASCLCIQWRQPFLFILTRLFSSSSAFSTRETQSKSRVSLHQIRANRQRQLWRSFQGA